MVQPGGPDPGTSSGVGSLSQPIVSLLERMSANISYALDNFDPEISRKNDERAIRPPSWPACFAAAAAGGRRRHGKTRPAVKTAKDSGLGVALTEC